MKFTVVAVITALFWSCSVSESVPPYYDFEIDNREIGIFRESYATIYFNEGNNDYSFTVQGDCISATLVEDGPEFGALSIYGEKNGKASVEITDRVIDKTIRVDVTVSEAGLFLRYKDHAVNVTGEDEDVIEEIRRKAERYVSEEPLFVADKDYFTSRDGDRFYSLEESGLYRTEYLFRNEQGEGIDLYLILTDEESYRERTLEVRYESGYYNGFLMYAGFFSMFPDTYGTRLNMPSLKDYSLLLQEDVSRLFTGRYGDISVIAYYLLRQELRPMPGQEI